MNLIEIVKENKVFAVIRAENSGMALALAEACIEGGLRLIEVTFSFGGAEEVISELRNREGIIVGAGTVLDVDTARTAADSGAKFIICPHTEGEIIAFCKQEGLFVGTGALTSTEILKAWNLGVNLVKIFPVKSVGGPSYVRSIKETLPFIDVMTTGGVTTENMTEFFVAGATAVGLSSALLGKDRNVDIKTVTERAREVAHKLDEYERKS